MLRTVVDTNVIVSGLIKPDSTPELILMMIPETRHVRICLSDDIFLLRSISALLRICVQKTAPLSFCTPPDLHSILYKINGELVLFIRSLHCLRNLPYGIAGGRMSRKDRIVFWESVFSI